MDILKKLFPLSFSHVKDTNKLGIGILIYVLVPVLLGLILGLIAGLLLPLAFILSPIFYVIDTVLGLYCLAGLVIQLLVQFDVIK